MPGAAPILAAVPVHVIIVIAALVVNGLIAAWKKAKERAAAAEAARAPRPGGAAEIDARVQQRRIQRAAPRALEPKIRRAPLQQSAQATPPAAIAPRPAPVRPTPAAAAAVATPTARPTRAAQPARPAATAAAGLLRDRASLRRAVLLGELLGPARGAVPYRPVA